MRRFLILMVGLAIATGAYLAASTVIWATMTTVNSACLGLHGATTPAYFEATWGAPPDQDVVDAAPYRFSDAGDVTIPSRTPGISLSAWWAPPKQPESRAVIVIHGRDSCRHDPTVLLPAGMLHRAGFGVLLVDLRNHGTSGKDNGHWAGGTDEWQDVLGAFDWLRARGLPASAIGLAGQSMGAGAVAYALGHEPSVPAAWLDSPYADIVSMSMEVAGGPVQSLFAPGALLMGQVVGGDPLLGETPERVFEERLAGRPVAIVHGTADRVIPVGQGERLAAAATRGGTPVTPWIIEGGRHVEAAFVQTAEYERRIVAFFRASLTASS